VFICVYLRSSAAKFAVLSFVPFVPVRCARGRLFVVKKATIQLAL
jgi:hypothetical protein